MRERRARFAPQIALSYQRVAALVKRLQPNAATPKALVPFPNGYDQARSVPCLRRCN
jgi:hypothetical protein